MKAYCLFLLLSLAAALPAQQLIRLDNPSFEDLPRHSSVPIGWSDASPYPGESPPDTQPCGEYAVTVEPYHGKTYLGMVARDNGTAESVGQRLDTALQVGKCYALSLYLMRSPQYVSVSRRTGLVTNFNTPIVLNVYGSAEGVPTQLIGATPDIANEHWLPVVFEFEAEGPYDVLLLEAAHAPERQRDYNGNLLLDHLGPIQQVPCGIYSAEELLVLNRLYADKAQDIPARAAEQTLTEYYDELLKAQR